MEERLQKIIARCGVASRRAAETLISQGRVSINGVTVKTLGVKADSDKDEIRVDGKLIALEETKVYLMLNKPRGYVTSLRDPQNRPIVSDLLDGVTERVFPIGRLDYDSEGMLLLTNDGQLAQRLSHPRYRIPKTYRVKIDGKLTRGDVRSIALGIDLDDGLFKPESLNMEKFNRKSSWLVLTVSEGRNRLIRRGFQALGYNVSRLVRIAIADLRLDALGEGKYRHLTPGEVKRLAALLASSGGKDTTRR
ncbi:MAG: rRNA pseudouridine synthase [Deltaproteobacteria bacterium]|nr:rRNA pseudouridine synthase [Deltaproteobacteria bacterium]